MRKSAACVLFSVILGCGAASAQTSSTLSLSRENTSKLVTLAESEARIPVGSDNVKATWYAPDIPAPAALVILQHGFQRERKHVASMARLLASHGYLVLTMSLGFWQLSDRNFHEQFASLVSKGTLPLPSGVTRPQKLILVGHSMGGLLVTHTAASLTNWGEPPQGVLLLDVVERGRDLREALSKINPDTTPTLAILGEPSMCNGFGSARSSIHELQQPFLGVHIPAGSHCDAEGESSDWVCSMTCGASLPANVQKVRDFSVQWIQDMLQGGIEAKPGDARFDEMIRSGAIKTL